MRTAKQVFLQAIGNKKALDIEVKDVLNAMEQYAIEYHNSEVKKLNLHAVMQQSEQLNAFREFAKQNYGGLALFSLEEIMGEYLKSI